MRELFEKEFAVNSPCEKTASGIEKVFSFLANGRALSKYESDDITNKYENGFLMNDKGSTRG